MDFADGQKIAKKLSVQISKETNSIKALLPVHNSCQSILENSSLLLLDEALDPSKCCALLSMPHFSETKQQVIEAALMLKRSSEEIVMLREESQNTLQYYQPKQQVIAHVLESLGTKCDAYSRGAIELLQKMHSVVSKIHQECLQAFAMS